MPLAAAESAHELRNEKGMHAEMQAATGESNIRSMEVAAAMKRVHSGIKGAQSEAEAAAMHSGACDDAAVVQWSATHA